MSPEAQRTSFAEACGWKHRLATHQNPVERAGMRLPNHFGRDVEAWWHDDHKDHAGVYGVPPNYPNDLNAMREALMSLNLTLEQKRKYGITLLDIVERDGADPTRFNHVTSSAAQQLEAILRTLGKWEDGK